MINIDRNIGRININLKVMYVGEDLLIVLSGGDRPHIGAISYGGVNDENKTVALKHHRDDVISDLFSRKISSVFKGNYVICAGVHLDNITKDEILQVKSLSEELLEEIILIIRKGKI